MQPQWKSLLKSIARQLIPNAGSVLLMVLVLFVYNIQAAGMQAAAEPATTQVLSYQGTLSTADGTPIDGSIGLTFRLYAAQSGGAALWSEDHSAANAVPVRQGLFQVLLGSLTPIPATVWDNPSVYLGVQVEGDEQELSPREIISAVPVALQVANLRIPEGSIDTAKLADGAVTLSKLGNDVEFIPPDASVTGAKIASGAVTLDKLGPDVVFIPPDGSVTNARLAKGAVTSEKTAITYWNIHDTLEPTWQTTTYQQYVEVPGLGFTFTPPADGVVMIALSLTFTQNVSTTQLLCAIFANGQAVATTGTIRTIGDENCATNIAYPVQAGQEYVFSSRVQMSSTSGTLIVKKDLASQVSAVYFGAP